MTGDGEGSVADADGPGLRYRELDHRVGNGLGVLLAAFRLQARAAGGLSTGAGAAYSHCAEQLGAFAAVHARLRTSPNSEATCLGAFLRHLCADLEASWYAPRGIRLALNLPPIDLPIERCQAIALILVELLLNAAKYAFPEGRRGRVRVCLARSGSVIRLTVGDDGVGMRDLQSDGRVGEGQHLVRRLAKGLGGSVAWRTSERGTTAHLRCGRDSPCAGAGRTGIGA